VIQPMTASGPTLPTWAIQRVGGYPGYTGRDANGVATAALAEWPGEFHPESLTVPDVIVSDHPARATMREWLWRACPTTVKRCVL